MNDSIIKKPIHALAANYRLQIQKNFFIFLNQDVLLKPGNAQDFRFLDSLEVYVVDSLAPEDPFLNDGLLH